MHSTRVPQGGDPSRQNDGTVRSKLQNAIGRRGVRPPAPVPVLRDLPGFLVTFQLHGSALESFAETIKQIGDRVACGNVALLSQNNTFVRTRRRQQR
jgi:hypothetical protein